MNLDPDLQRCRAALAAIALCRHIVVDGNVVEVPLAVRVIASDALRPRIERRKAPVDLYAKFGLPRPANRS
jgi:hypothetical protein